MHHPTELKCEYIMLAQFQSLYPTGSLISELLTIYQGKYVIRVSAQVEGVLRATGMAASDSLELAEDQARIRALMVLGIQPLTTSTQSVEIAPQEEAALVSEPIQQTNPSYPVATTSETTLLNEPNYFDFAPASPQEESKPTPAFKSKSDRSNIAATDSTAIADATFESAGMKSSKQKKSSVSTPMSFDNVTPLVPRNQNFEQSTLTLENTAFETELAPNEPIDRSDELAKTDVEMARVGWSKKDGRDYLRRTYRKESRFELNDQELLEFLQYLESLPSANL